MRLILTVLVLSAAAAPAFAGCRPALDPSMVRYLPVTPSSGPNPLFRLVGGRSAAAGPARRCELSEQVAAGRR